MRGKSPWVSKTLLSILADLNNAVVLIISDSSSLFFKHLMIVPTISTFFSITVTFMFQLSGKIQIFIYLFIFFHFDSVVHWNSKIHQITSSFFLLIGVLLLTGHWHNGYSVRQWPGRPGFNHRSSHTKDSKNGTGCILA